MESLKIFAAFLLALVLSSVARAEIYETTDADGNTEFTDSPPEGDSELVNLPQTNISNATQPQPLNKQPPDPLSVEQQPMQENHSVIQFHVVALS